MAVEPRLCGGLIFGLDLLHCGPLCLVPRNPFRLALGGDAFFHRIDEVCDPLILGKLLIVAIRTQVVRTTSRVRHSASFHSGTHTSNCTPRKRPEPFRSFGTGRSSIRIGDLDTSNSVARQHLQKTNFLEVAHDNTLSDRTRHHRRGRATSSMRNRHRPASTRHRHLVLWTPNRSKEDRYAGSHHASRVRSPRW